MTNRARKTQIDFLNFALVFSNGKIMEVTIYEDFNMSIVKLLQNVCTEGVLSQTDQS